MTWPCSFEDGRIDLAATGKIEPADAERQMETVREILRRLERQPGLILADEVGMGKTFVALAVAASVSWGDRGRGPVVVMVPPSLKEKWPRDFMKFRNECLCRAEDRDQSGLRYASADDGVEFLKLLDDPPDRRNQIIFVTHGALHRGLNDRWTRLALLVEALRHRSLVAQRNVFPRFAAEILRTKSTTSDDVVYADLQKTSFGFWKDVLVKHGILGQEKDDPVPKAIYRLLDKDKVDLGRLREALKGVPLRDSAYRVERIQELRDALREPLKDLWTNALRAASFRSPLLILDEAHHLKNPETKLASLFVEEDAKEEANLLGGALKDRFERMLFLTATPFQLGHVELLNVLDRFRGIRWGNGTGAEDREGFVAELAVLKKEMDEAQRGALDLEKAWRRVRPEHVSSVDLESGLDAWWNDVLVEADRGEGPLRDVARQFGATARCMKAADKNLKKWVIRHLRPRLLERSGDRRRKTIPGAEITTGDGPSPIRASGLRVDGPALLPFLLVARSQAIISALPSSRLRTQVGSTSFVEGLASSFEAYRETRDPSKSKDRTVVDESGYLEGPAPDALAGADRLKRYVLRLDRALVGLEDQHPKVRATVAKATELWKKGEKVLVFCHFRATVRALAEHLSQSIQTEIEETVIRALGCERSEVNHRLQTISEAFDTTRSAFRELVSRTRSQVNAHGEAF